MINNSDRVHRWSYSPRHQTDMPKDATVINNAFRTSVCFSTTLKTHGYVWDDARYKASFLMRLACFLIYHIYIHKQLCIITSFVHTFHSGIPWNITVILQPFLDDSPEKNTSFQWRHNRSQHDPGKVPYLIIRPCKHIILPEKNRKPTINQRFGNGFNPTYLWLWSY